MRQSLAILVSVYYHLLCIARYVTIYKEMKKYFMKMQKHENVNAPSEIILIHNVMSLAPYLDRKYLNVLIFYSCPPSFFTFFSRQIDYTSITLLSKMNDEKYLFGNSV